MASIDTFVRPEPKPRWATSQVCAPATVLVPMSLTLDTVRDVPSTNPNALQ